MGETDLAAAAGTYVSRLIESSNRAKILLLDDETTSILSLATTQSNLLRHDVFLIDKINSPSRQKMRHLDAVVFVRPTSESVSAILDELRSPRYAQYSLIFTNTVRKSQLERLAEADDHEVVVRVQEMFLDWRKINDDLFTVGVSNPWLSTSPGAWDAEALEASIQSVFAVVGSLRLGQPTVRFDANSALSRAFATQLEASLSSPSAHLPSAHGSSASRVSPKSSSTVVLVLDRFNDPITPLVSHWTYQAMVAEIIGIQNNRVDLGGAPDVPTSHREIVLAEDQDSFFHDTMYLNFGDLGAAVREYVQHYSSRSKSSQQLETVADIKKFVDGLPEFRRLQDNTTKHVSLVGELSRRVEADHLLVVSEVEQSLATQENHASDLHSIQEILAMPGVAAHLKYRLIALYALRYRNHSQVATEQLLQTLSISAGSSPELDRAVRNLLSVYASSRFPQEDLFNQGSLLLRAQQGLKGLRGVENVYTQYKSLLDTVVNNLVRNKLPTEKYPYVRRSLDSEPTAIVIFIIGGVTFEEARVVGEYNRANPRTRIVLGGTDTVNSQQFLDVLSQMTW